MVPALEKAADDALESVPPQRQTVWRRMDREAVIHPTRSPVAPPLGKAPSLHQVLREPGIQLPEEWGMDRDTLPATVIEDYVTSFEECPEKLPVFLDVMFFRIERDELAPQERCPGQFSSFGTGLITTVYTKNKPVDQVHGPRLIDDDGEPIAETFREEDPAASVKIASHTPRGLRRGVWQENPHLIVPCVGHHRLDRFGFAAFGRFVEQLFAAPLRHRRIEPWHPDTEIVSGGDGFGSYPLSQGLNRLRVTRELILVDVDFINVDELFLEKGFVAAGLVTEIRRDVGRCGAGHDNHDPRGPLRRAVVRDAPQPPRIPDVIEPVFELPVGVLVPVFLLGLSNKEMAIVFDLIVDTLPVDVFVCRDDHEHGALRGEQPMGVVVDLLATEIPDVDSRRRAVRVVVGFERDLLQADVECRFLRDGRISRGTSERSPRFRRQLNPRECLRDGRLPAAAAPEKQDLRHP